MVAVQLLVDALSSTELQVGCASTHTVDTLATSETLIATRTAMVYVFVDIDAGTIT